MQPPSPDIVSIEGLPVHTTIGLDIFGRSLPQPYILTIHFHLHPTSLLLAAATDDSRFSIRYWDLEDQVLERVNDGAPWTSGRALARAVTGVAFMHAGDAVKELRIVLEAQNGHPRATGGMRWELTTPHGAHTQEVVASAHGLELGVLLGGVDQEQRVKQRIVMDIWFLEKVQHSSEVDYLTIVNRVIEVRTASRVMERCRVVLRGVGDRGVRTSDIRPARP